MRIEGVTTGYPVKVNQDVKPLNEQGVGSRFEIVDSVEISTASQQRGAILYPPYSEPPPIGDPDD